MGRSFGLGLKVLSALKVSDNTNTEKKSIPTYNPRSRFFWSPRGL